MRSVTIVMRADEGTNFTPGTLTNRRFTVVVSMRLERCTGSRYAAVSVSSTLRDA